MSIRSDQTFLITSQISEILLSNNSGAARVVNIWIIESGDSRDNSNEITGGGLTVPTGIPWPVVLATAMEASDKIDIDADGADVAAIGTGVVET